MRERLSHPRRFRCRLDAGVLLLSGALTVTGCTGRSGDGPSGPDALLEANRQRWEARGLTDYTFRYQLVCFCLTDYVRPALITVRGGQVAEAQFVDGPEPQPADPAIYPTVDELFDRLEEALGQKPERFDVSYDRELGYPTSANVDISAQIADEEFSFEASALTPAGSDSPSPD